jgi:hypothetical protein
MPDNLKYTKDLFIYLPEFRNAYKRNMNPQYGAFIVKMISRMPNLQTFRWVYPSIKSSTKDDSWLDKSAEKDPEAPTRILTQFGILQALKLCTFLQNLSIQLDINGNLGGSFYFFPIKGLQNLSSVELYNLHKPKDALIRQLVNVLIRCPQLRTLGLSLSCECDDGWIPSVLLVYEMHVNFFERLCNEYSAKRGSKPLELQNVRLGYGLYIISKNMDGDGASDEEQKWCPGNFLAGFVKLDGLKTLHLYNGPSHHLGNGEHHEKPLDIAWSFFHDCASLRHFQITRLSSEAVEWLADHGNEIEELIVTDYYNIFDEELETLRKSQLPKLTMLFSREMAARRLDIGVSTILDRLRDKGEALIRFAFCIDLEMNGSVSYKW